MKFFCCCLPVRLGVFVLTVLTFVVSGFLSVVGWRSFAMIKDSLSTGQDIATVLATLSWTLLCFFSVAGFIGTLIASLPLVSAYSRVLFGHWVIDLAITVAYVIVWVKLAGEVFVARCVAGSGDLLNQLAGNLSQGVQNATHSVTNDPLVSNLTSGFAGDINNGTANVLDEQTRQNICQKSFTVFKVSLIVGLVIYKLITLYGCIISHRYVVQLRGERTEKRWRDVEHKVDQMGHDKMRLPGAGAV